MFSFTPSTQRRDLLIYVVLLTIQSAIGSNHKLNILDKESFRQVWVGSDVTITCVGQVHYKTGENQNEANVTFSKHILSILGSDISDLKIFSKNIPSTGNRKLYISTLVINKVTYKHEGYYSCLGRFPLDDTAYGLLHDVVYLGVTDDDNNLDWSQVVSDGYNGNPSLNLDVTVVGGTKCVEMGNCTLENSYQLPGYLWQRELAFENETIFVKYHKDLDGLLLQINANDASTNQITTAPLKVELSKEEDMSMTVSVPNQALVSEPFSAKCTAPANSQLEKTISLSFEKNHVKKFCKGEENLKTDQKLYKYNFTVSSHRSFSIIAEIKSDFSGKIQCGHNQMHKNVYEDVCVQSNSSLLIEGPSEVVEGEEFELKCSGPPCTGAMGPARIVWMRDEVPGFHEAVPENCAYRSSSTLKMKKADSSSRVYTCAHFPEKSSKVNNRTIYVSKQVSVIPSSKNYETEWTNLRLTIVLSSVGAGMVIIALITFAVYLWVTCPVEREKRQLRRALYGKIEQRINEETVLHEQAHLLQFDRKWEFPRKRLNLGKQLGIGNFGVVYEADAKNKSGDETTVVAVKMAHQQTNTEVILSMVKELKIMSHVSGHINIVNLLGAVVDKLAERDLMLIVEYCPFGNLQKYLIDNRHRYKLANTVETFLDEEKKPHSYTNVKVADGKVMPFNEAILIGWSYQISQGMAWLSKRKVLHGDLAARNILLSTNNIVKISDFGLSSNLNYSTVYEKKGGSALPLPWLAVESLLSLQFSSQTDVWSYGIVLWEMFSLGRRPYVGFEMPDELITRLQEGYRLDHPEHAPIELYNLMRRCWQHEPLQRPTFEEIKGLLARHMEDHSTEQREYLKKLQEHDMLPVQLLPELKTLQESTKPRYSVLPVPRTRKKQKREEKLYLDPKGGQYSNLTPKGYLGTAETQF